MKADSAAVLVVLVAFLAVLHSAVACFEGGKVSATVDPVCGSDGLTYMNSCFASVQDVQYTPGPCMSVSAAAAGGVPFEDPMAGVLAAAAAAAPKDAAVAPETLTAFAHEQLRMVAVMPVSSFPTRTGAVTEEHLQKMRSKALGSAGTTMMITDQGHLYAAPPGAAAAGPGSATTAPSAVAAAATITSTPATVSSSAAGSGKQENDLDVGGRRRLRQRLSSTGRRMLGIFGQDSRREVVNLLDWPWSPVGHITFNNVDTGYLYQCTGSMIGTFTVLTTAHCVVSRSGLVQPNWQFTPAQTAKYPSGLGTARGKRMYFNSNYLTDFWYDWDVAIMVVDMAYGAPDVPAFTTAMAEAVSLQFLHITEPLPVPVPPIRTAQAYAYDDGPVINKTKLYSLGYPADKPYKSAWRMACWVTDRRSDEPVLRNRCPTMSGQSGAPMVEQRRSRDGSNSMQYVVRAVVSHEVCKAVCGMTCCPKMSSYNGAVKITRHFKRFIDKNRNQRPYEPSRRRRL